ncbi:MAG: pepSY-associated helix family protein [Verrucomicrobiaceae bacterium]|nr:pepSY-associated helix family protein [Verrucomicrobiaceae bacterium]
MSSPAPTDPSQTSPVVSAVASAVVTKNARRSGWLKTLHQWHWISSALCLMCILLFSFTGITLNHAAQIEAHAKVVSRKAQIPAELLEQARQFSAAHDGATEPPPQALQRWIEQTESIRIGDNAGEWSAEEFYLPLPRPGGDAWLRIDLVSGGLEYEVTDRGWISWLNDLHKGRHTGAVWMWFIDLFAVACLIFSLTGLLILKFHAANRASTWPIVGLGVLIPLLLALFFIH